ncbi:EamA family transporter [Candidatus Woesearchaeota archaeon]|nr:EamA family transporter [Candidatus Woesearchaeota archaeon]
MNPAIVFIILAVIASTIKKVLDRYVAVRASVFSFAIVTQFLASLLFLPFALPYLALPASRAAWIALGLGCIIWTIMSLTIYLAIKKAEVSIKEPLHQSKLIWTLLFGALFLGESLTTTKIVGTIIIFVGLAVLLFHPERKLGRLTEPDVLWTLGHALLGAIAVIVDKNALTYFAPEAYGFIVYLVPGILLTMALPKKYPEVKNLLKAHAVPTLATITLATAAYFFALQAYARADATVVYPMLQLSTILAVIAGIVVLREREHRWQKIAATVLVIIGAIVLRL